jgi:hypothetical protein
MFIILIASFPDTDQMAGITSGALGCTFGLLILFGTAMTGFTYILSIFFKFVTVLVGKIQKRDEDYLALENQKEQIEDQLKKLQDEQPLALLESKLLFLLVTCGIFTYNAFIC